MNLRSIDLNLLTVFEAVYEEGSQARAAEHIGMTQPAVSNALARLKYITKDALFTGKPGQPLIPTPRAKEIYDQIHHGLDLIRTGLSDELEFEPSRSHREFSISISYGGGSILGKSLYEIISTEAPNVRLTMRSIDPEKEAVALLRDNSLDILLHHCRFPGKGLAHEQIYQHQPVIIARKAHPRIRDAFTREDALNERFAIVYDAMPHGYIAHPELDRWLDAVDERIMLKVPNFMTLLLIVAESDLLAFSTQQLVHRMMGRFEINSYAMPWQVARAPLYMIWQRNAQFDPGHRWLREKIKASIRDTWIAPYDERKHEGRGIDFGGLFTNMPS
ncbi:LysR family transcriptional regulator [Candidatus Methylospira mobilis]|uniref:LysR family transcriptional regulator n=1 Tax=Candidatus Methylospira mobilis TaxID=1808979 RepID=A0A5Q0BCR6_9GAMM|nr:LysR substrate-binding domain-containing protein [Candidatus Methylospira mobilis]QFY41309.1 LysR family transcriptional regulator [Candidatus Methylospira mobilis]WNV05468.1 LysR substrate-binding domain-containing protein [Candidatus Methylospira mobilis]